MAGRGFLNVARAVSTGPSEYYWRAAVVHAYYAIFLGVSRRVAVVGPKAGSGAEYPCMDALECVYAASDDLKKLADALDELVRLRNKASYELTTTVLFSSPAIAQDAIQTAEHALALLDQIQADAVRRQAAIASLPP